MKKFWKKFKLFFREIGNFLTNLLCPIVSIVIAGMEALQLPIKWIEFMKKVEYWCWKACGTKEVIEDMIEKVDEQVEKNTK